MKNQTTIQDQVKYVRNGGDLKALRQDETLRLQEYALDIKDIRLYDYLDKFWKRV